jgi:hypothetical protein
MMRTDWLASWLDNPIFVKHLRSRLRRQPLIMALVITQVLCLCIAWSGFQLDAFKSGGALGALFALQAIILCIMGATQVGTSVASAKASGILDFHRVSPLSPTELVLGFFFGAPVREYVLFASTLPISFLCLAMGAIDFRALFQLMLVLLSTSWVLHGLSVLNALMLKKQAGARGVVGLVIFLGFMTSSMFSGFGNLLSRLDQDPRLEFFGISLPWLVVVLLYQIPVLFFVFLAARRKMDSERLHPFSKPQGIAAMATLGVLLLGGIWSLDDSEVLPTLMIYLLVILGIVLTVMVTPTQAEYYKGLWRALKQGQVRLSFWDDLALNRPFLAVICAIALVTATMAWNRLAAGNNFVAASVRQSFPLAIANGVLVVGYFGLAHQFFLLRFGRRGGSFFALFLFLTWVVPLVIGTIILFSHFNNSGPSQTIYALSPLAGVGLATGIGEGSYLFWIQAAAITPSLLYAFVFNGLVTAARRRVARAVAAGFEKTRAAAAPSS